MMNISIDMTLTRTTRIARAPALPERTVLRGRPSPEEDAYVDLNAALDAEIRATLQIRLA